MKKATHKDWMLSKDWPRKLQLGVLSPTTTIRRKGRRICWSRNQSFSVITLPRKLLTQNQSFVHITNMVTIHWTKTGNARRSSKWSIWRTQIHKIRSRWELTSLVSKTCQRYSLGKLMLTGKQRCRPNLKMNLTRRTMSLRSQKEMKLYLNPEKRRD
jgi:hypothetical protein